LLKDKVLIFLLSLLSIFAMNVSSCVRDECKDGEGYCDGNVRVSCGYAYSDSGAPRVWERLPCGEWSEPPLCVGSNKYTDYPVCVMSTTPEPACIDNPQGDLISFCVEDVITSCRGVYKVDEDQEKKCKD
jgi:hypothetical protein